MANEWKGDWEMIIESSCSLWMIDQKAIQVPEDTCFVQSMGHNKEEKKKGAVRLELEIEYIFSNHGRKTLVWEGNSGQF